MTLFKRILTAALVILGLTLAGQSHAGITNVDALGIGSSGDSTYIYLTGVSTVKQDLAFGEIRDFNMAPVAQTTPITSILYVSQATGLTNHAAVFVDPALAPGRIKLQHRVRDNYRSGGTLYARVHASGTVTSQHVSITADAYINRPDATTVTTKAAGTLVNLPTTADVQINDLALTNSNATFYPNATVTWDIRVSNAGTRTVQFLGFYFSYRPGGVMASMPRSLWPGENGNALSFLDEVQVPVFLHPSYDSIVAPRG